MGIPKFFRWISERYPKIIQRHGSRPVQATFDEHFGDDNRNRNDFNESDASNSSTHLPSPDDDLWLQPDPLSTCGLAPEIDRLYIDVNGIIHGCSHHNNDDDAKEDRNGGGNENGHITQTGAVTEEQIAQNVCYYLDRLVRDILQPTELLYLAVDGVAPRAKLNQQRARRYRSGKEGEIEKTAYDAHTEALLKEKNMEAMVGDSSSLSPLQEIEPGRFAGKFESTRDDTATTSSIDAATHFSGNDCDTATEIGTDSNNSDTKRPFHSVQITPATEFFSTFSKHIEAFLEHKLATDPQWKHLTVIYSGSGVPGEGEHKIMQFLREQRSLEDENYNSQLRHCIVGQDGDLILLGLLSHEPNMTLFRERVLFDQASQARDEKVRKKYGLGAYLHQANFEFLHMNVLRDYLAMEFETKNVVQVDTKDTSAISGENSNKISSKHQQKPPAQSLPTSAYPYDLERCIDDFCFLTFLVGNDFLPHLPALDIGDEAMEFLFAVYAQQRQLWVQEIQKSKSSRDSRNGPYLTHQGNIVSASRLESFFTALGSHESHYHSFKKTTDDPAQARKLEQKWGYSMTPSDQVLASKEQADRTKYRSAMRLAVQQQVASNNKAEEECDDSAFRRESVTMEEEEGMFAKMATLLQNSVAAPLPPPFASEKKNDGNDYETDIPDMDDDGNSFPIDDQDVKGRYYYDKFGMTPFDTEEHVALRKAYLEGLVWNLKYYWQGCPSWDFYYPYHYAPMMSDMVGLEDLLHEIQSTYESSDGALGAPLRPVEQLLACLPPSHAHLLPEPYRFLMTNREPTGNKKTKMSPIADFYPSSFTIDMNGKRWPWEAVVLLPFIDADRLREAVEEVGRPEDILTAEELERNAPRDAIVLRHVSNSNSSNYSASNKNLTHVEVLPFDLSPWSLTKKTTKKHDLSFRAKLLDGVEVPTGGYPTLLIRQLQSLNRKGVHCNVHGSLSRYTTVLLEMRNPLPEHLVTLELLTETLVGTSIHINYPHLLEAFVTAVSDSTQILRGKNPSMDGAATTGASFSSSTWTPQESAAHAAYTRRIVTNSVFGERLPGTAGLSLAEGQDAMEALGTLLHVRPFQGLQSMEHTNGNVTTGKRFADFEMQVPLFHTAWTPTRPDPRLENMPALLERNPYTAAVRSDFATFMKDQTNNASSSNKPNNKLVIPPFNNRKTTSYFDRRLISGLGRIVRRR